MPMLTGPQVRVADRKFLMDPYLDWAESLGLPIHEDFFLNLLELEVAPWDRSGTRAAVVHVGGRGDFANTFLHAIDPGGHSERQQHLFDAVVYVLSGHGRTSFEVGGETISFEWGPRSMFAIPPNVKYQFFNMTGTEEVRYALATDAPLLFKLFRNEEFIFDNDADFSYRLSADARVTGDGTLIPNLPGRHMWETNFVPDLGSFELKEWKERGAGGTNISFVLADGSLHAHVSQIPVGTYKKAHRHDAGVQIFPVTGKGYSLVWYEGDATKRQVRWEHGYVYAPDDDMFHQHFNLSTEPSRYMATMFGSMRYPMTDRKTRIILGVDVDVRDGGAQIEYADQDPDVDKLYQAECEAAGAPYLMEKFLA
ncbi:hypothetical protein [Actinophytocola sp.]|uniref:hypothetical protein n=1 Tax=Actinophytocola sp. TaxID=1872138 RepID=UPI003D6B1C69